MPGGRICSLSCEGGLPLSYGTLKISVRMPCGTITNTQRLSEVLALLRFPLSSFPIIKASLDERQQLFSIQTVTLAGPRCCLESVMDRDKTYSPLELCGTSSFNSTLHHVSQSQMEIRATSFVQPWLTPWKHTLRTQKNPAWHTFHHPCTSLTLRSCIKRGEFWGFSH